MNKKFNNHQNFEWWQFSLVVVLKLFYLIFKMFFIFDHLYYKPDNVQYLRVTKMQWTIDKFNLTKNYPELKSPWIDFHCFCLKCQLQEKIIQIHEGRKLLVNNSNKMLVQEKIRLYKPTITQKYKVIKFRSMSCKWWSSFHLNLN